MKRVEDSTTSYDGRVDCNIETRWLSLVACQIYLFASSVCRLMLVYEAVPVLILIEHPMIILMTSFPRLPPTGGGRTQV